MLDAQGPNHAGPSSGRSPLTISDWRALQASGGGLDRLCALADAERLANETTRVWISVASAELLGRQWSQLQLLREDPAASLPLLGVPFAVKDNIDVSGFATTAGCPAFASGPAAFDAPVVARLRAAGAIVIGKTNLDQFATGLVGTRSPYGAVPNSFDPSRVSGGSSSGSGVAVARGAVPFSLGTDTAGSGRVPAGFNNIVGLKPTRGALSAHGVVPACRTLDCVSIFALTVDDAELILSVAEGFDAQDSYSRSRPQKSASQTISGLGSRSRRGSRPVLAICAEPPWFDRDDHRPAYDASLEKAKTLGWDLRPVDFSPLFALAQLLYRGPWVAERYHAVKDFIQSVDPDAMDPVVRGILKGAESLSAVDAYDGEYLRKDLTRRIELAFAEFDGILVPTTPTFPTMAQVAKDPVEENSRLGTYTNFVNFLDWSALSVPAGFRADGLPFGVTLIANQWQEPKLLEWAKMLLSSSIRSLGITSASCIEPVATTPSEIDEAATEKMSVAVVGAHLSGMPLNKDLVSRGAILSRVTKTSLRYKLYSLPVESGPPRPGLRRVASDQGGAEIPVEVWTMPQASVGSFLATIPSPLSIGKIELRDETWVSGFICEPFAFEGAEDITSFGGWRSYIKHRSRPALMQHGPLNKVLIANRGEIAVRIIKTLHQMGLKAIAIHSKTDAKAPHVRDADEAYELLGTSITETYLNSEQILNIARLAEADAIIPGYGFLAESSEFAKAVEDAGLVWVGPTPSQMSDSGLKHCARAIAMEAGVPTVPGSRGLLSSVQEALTEAETVGYPLMLKSTAGGGGIGMSLCKTENDLKNAFEGVRLQATANFGNGAVFLERYVGRARHVEIQIIGDGKGRVATAGERDCTLQRRNQKVVEESPGAAIPEKQRMQMKEAAVRLAAHVKYRNVGTVEFIYDVDAQAFYFLEVNTRLQVEHPVTELVTGLDLVECMLKVAAGEKLDLFEQPVHHVPTSGASIELRLYAESPLENFLPCAGTISKLNLPANLRVDTWVEEGTPVTTSYDPLIAKLISYGSDRREALRKLADGLANTTVEGVKTNLEYLRQIVASEMFASNEFTTKTLDKFQVVSSSLEILEPGAQTYIQDYPGRRGYWDIGVPPSGPMDTFSFRLANRLVGNPEDAAGIECTLQGPAMRFHCPTLIAITGGEASITLDNEPISTYATLPVAAGQTLRIGPIVKGYRVYVGVRGGIDVPVVMGSRSTFELGKMGGFEGRKLQARDIIQVGLAKPLTARLETYPALALPPQPEAQWNIRVLTGPHGEPDFFTPGGLRTLFESPWTVHHNSNRLGVRLTGPKPEWARSTGGKAGMHPSNIHDSPYSIGSVSFTGDEAVILACDGPSLGGFVVFCVIATADMWKMGQLRPGDSVRFQIISARQALELDSDMSHAIENLRPLSDAAITLPEPAPVPINLNGILGRTTHNKHEYAFRQAGDFALLLEIDGAEDFNLHQSVEIWEFCEQHRRKPIPGVLELTPGVATIHVIYELGQLANVMVERILQHLKSCRPLTSAPSRTIHLPFVLDDEACRTAVKRYAATIRGKAPWLPSNIDFLKELNGITDMSKLMLDSCFLVLGLGDVFLGSPCAVPLDPRHRLFGTKYNPSRSFTPRGAVGIGGQYLCIYATESPGGYQLVGKTIDIWDLKKQALVKGSASEKLDVKQAPWLFRVLDRITFYPVTQEELDSKSAEELTIISEGFLSLAEHDAFLRDNEQSILEYQKRQTECISNAPFLEDLRRPYVPEVGADGSASRMQATEGVDFDENSTQVRAAIPGRIFKINVAKGDIVAKDEPLLSLESSKMEVQIHSPCSGKCRAVLANAGDIVTATDVVIVLDPVTEN